MTGNDVDRNLEVNLELRRLLGPQYRLYTAELDNSQAEDGIVQGYCPGSWRQCDKNRGHHITTGVIVVLADDEADAGQVPRGVREATSAGRCADGGDWECDATDVGRGVSRGFGDVSARSSKSSGMQSRQK